MKQQHHDFGAEHRLPMEMATMLLEMAIQMYLERQKEEKEAARVGEMSAMAKEEFAARIAQIGEGEMRLINKARQEMTDPREFEQYKQEIQTQGSMKAREEMASLMSQYMPQMGTDVKKLRELKKDCWDKMDKRFGAVEDRPLACRDDNLPFHEVKDRLEAGLLVTEGAMRKQLTVGDSQMNCLVAQAALPGSQLQLEMAGKEDPAVMLKVYERCANQSAVERELVKTATRLLSPAAQEKLTLKSSQLDLVQNVLGDMIKRTEDPLVGRALHEMIENNLLMQTDSRLQMGLYLQGELALNHNLMAAMEAGQAVPSNGPSQDLPQSLKLDRKEFPSCWLLADLHREQRRCDTVAVKEEAKELKLEEALILTAELSGQPASSVLAGTEGFTGEQLDSHLMKQVIDHCDEKTGASLLASWEKHPEAFAGQGDVGQRLVARMPQLGPSMTASAINL